MTGPASRVLFSIIISLTSIHPRSVVSGILLPVLIYTSPEGTPTSPQKEVVRRVLQEALAPEHALDGIDRYLKYCAGKSIDSSEMQTYASFLSSASQHDPSLSSTSSSSVLTTMAPTSPVSCWTDVGVVAIKAVLDRKDTRVTREIVIGIAHGAEESARVHSADMKFTAMLFALVSKYPNDVGS